MKRQLLIRMAVVALAGIAASDAFADPRNPANFASLGVFAPTSNVVINTDTKTITFGATTFTGVSDGGVAVFTFDSINVPAGVQITVTGSQPLALLAHGNLTIAGTVNAGFRTNATPMPTGGGGAGGAGGAANTFATPVSNGQPGAGPGGGGGGIANIPSPSSGGSHAGLGGGFQAGPTYGDLNFVLQGGSGGGGGAARALAPGGGFGESVAGAGGSGGGAVELGAAGLVAISGTIFADGNQGLNGFTTLASGFAGGGSGGSGGAVLVHGETVSVSGTINARGGVGSTGVAGGGFGLTGAGGGGGRVLVLASEVAYAPNAPVAISVGGGAGGLIDSSGAAGVATVSPTVLVVPAGQVLQMTGTGVAAQGMWGASVLARGLRLEGGAAAIVTSPYAANGDLTINQGGLLAALAGMTSERRVTLNGGAINAAGGLGLTNAGSVSGFGQVGGPFAGAAGSTITVNGGTLTIGDANSTSGFAFDGTATIASGATLNVQDANVATLGSQTVLGDGARLASLNGIELGSGDVLTSRAMAVIDGLFINQGLVNGSTEIDEFLQFMDDVTGGGDFTGNIRFSGGYSPGNSPASVTLENMFLDDTAVLTMELGGLFAGTHYDHLNITGTATLDGVLEVLLLDGFSPTFGNTFNLFDGTLVGAFDSLVLPTLTAGLTWDFSSLYTSGELRVAGTEPVPEPATLALFGAGLATACWRRRAARRHRM